MLENTPKSDFLKNFVEVLGHKTFSNDLKFLGKLQCVDLHEKYGSADHSPIATLWYISKRQFVVVFDTQKVFLARNTKRKILCP